MMNCRGYLFRIYPTEIQVSKLKKIFDAVCFVHNELLTEWIQDRRLDFQTELKRLIKRNPWLSLVDCSILTHTAQCLERSCEEYGQSFPAFPAAAAMPSPIYHSGNMHVCPPSSLPSSPDFPRESGGPASVPYAHPRFKTSEDVYASFTISADHSIRVQHGWLILDGQKELRPIRIELTRPLPVRAHIRSATLSRHPTGSYYISLACRIPFDTVPSAEVPASVGIICSPEHFFRSSDDTLIPDEVFLHRDAEDRNRLSMQRHHLKHMRPGSSNYRKQLNRIAGLQERVRFRSRDYLQKLSTVIADRYDIVCIEPLAGAGEGPGLFCVSGDRWRDYWSEFTGMLDYKLTERGGRLITVDKWYPALCLCHSCGFVNEGLLYPEEVWICPGCGARIARDRNASQNVLEEGLRAARGRREQTPLPFPADAERPQNRITSSEEMRNPQPRTMFYIRSDYGESNLPGRPAEQAGSI